MFLGSVRQREYGWRERVPVNSFTDRRADGQTVLRSDDY